ncbi:MAG: flagellin lysine-N-methylase [Oscillospiraceae bacterium]|nr:flagellin lysine-N-methylase [Oscillospiraceae bacterium]
MKLITPDYYRRFQCIAAACPDSCCKEWEVDVDEAAAARYRSLSGQLGEDLRTCLRDTEDGAVMTITEGRCPMWRQDGLCRIQAELGHDALCQTCREFPRLRHDYGDFVELGLELSCPEAARLIFADGKLRTATQSLPGGEAPDYDREAMEILLRSRETVLEFLEQTSCPLPEALAVLLLYSCSVQNWLDGSEEPALDPEAALEEARGYAETGDLEGILAFFLDLEILTDSWRSRLAQGTYSRDWSNALLPLAVYGIRRYWLQAVSDYDLLCRVKLILVSCILVNALGGDPVQTSQQFSKEIENDPDNLDAILDATYTARPFTDRNLLSLLLPKT